MRIDLRCLHVGMAQELLNHADIDAVFQQMGGKAVPEGMTGEPFRDAGAIDCHLHRFLQPGFEYVVAPDEPGARVGAQRFGRKDVLLAELLAGTTVFPGKSRGQIDFAISLL